jgi:hypothetical protein
VSILRCGDGESFVLNGKNDPDKLKYVIQRQLGYLPPITEMMEIRDRLIEAYTNCDIIGIPVNNRFLSDLNSSWAKVKPILEKYVDTSEKIYSDIDFHSHFLDKGLFKELFWKIKKLYYVSCRNIGAQLKNKYRIDVRGFHISPEMKFSTEHYTKTQLDQVSEVKQWISEQDIEGSLCLFGAGVIGKIYGNWFRDAGGVAVDIGSVFDSWGGLKTRGQGRGAGVIDNTFKL